jgi:phosphoadenosine phosphosulfate reductase
LKAFEPPEGYFLAFSGGKDSLCIHRLALEAGVKFTAYYNLTTVDPPELVYFIRQHYPHVVINYPEESMWQLIVRHKTPPTRLIRYCCEELKEHGGQGHTVITGVRWAESNRRKQKRNLLELNAYTKQSIMLGNDNSEARRLFETCTIKSKHVVNPIIDWSDAEVWEFIHMRNLTYCPLYDQGFTRLGCIGCPLAGGPKMKWEFERYPKYRDAYIRTFDRMLVRRRETGLDPVWLNGRQVMAWWVGDLRLKAADEAQIQFKLY